METKVKNTLNNENGMIMVVVLIILVIITLLGLTASQTAITEIQIATNERQLVEDLCRAEGGLIDTLETSPAWMTDAFLTADPTTAAASVSRVVDFNGGGNDATVEVRCIEDTDPFGVVVPVPGLSAVANDIPVGPHITPPPPGSGFDFNFEVRRYAVTATSSTGNTQVQAGVFKVFNKF